jgi:hypothetical protein
VTRLSPPSMPSETVVTLGRRVEGYGRIFTQGLVQGKKFARLWMPRLTCHAALLNPVRYASK